MSSAKHDKIVLNFLAKFPEGADKNVIFKELKMECDSPELLLAAVNRLLANDKIQLLDNGFLKIKVKALAESEQLVFHLISEAGSAGVWAKDLRDKSRLLRAQLTKVIKQLEGKNLIKSVKGVTAQHNKKIFYFLRNVVPDRSITGGAFHNDNDLDTNFVKALHRLCSKYFATLEENVKNKTLNERIIQSYASVEDVSIYIKDSGISNVQLLNDDVESILCSMVFDGLIKESTVGMALTPNQDQNKNFLSPGKKVYRNISISYPNNGITNTPCGVCPVFNKCHEGNVVSPQTCVYMKEWLEF